MKDEGEIMRLAPELVKDRKEKLFDICQKMQRGKCRTNEEKFSAGAGE